MELCSHNHDEICYSERRCPMCQMRDDYEGQLESLREEKEGAESEINDLKNHISSYDQEIAEKNAELQRLYAGQNDGER